VASSAAAARHPLTPAQRSIATYGYVVAHPRAYAAAKAAAARHSGPAPPARAAAPAAALSGPSWKGLYDPTAAPSDSTGAVGTTRYVELVNTRYGIYDRAGVALDRGPLATLVGAGNDAYLTDPQVIWDADTDRFYYLTLDFLHSNFRFGFSQDDSPVSAADWCRYTLRLGYTNIPDYPKLGDTLNFLLVGVNVFAPEGSFLRSDVGWVRKPPPGPACPPQNAYPAPGSYGRQTDLRSAGHPTSTPVPANGIDSSPDGWIVATKDTTYRRGRFVSLFKVTGGPTPTIQRRATRVGVTAYRLPVNAPQPYTAKRLDTLDGRLTQAVAAVDPDVGAEPVVWSQHTIRGGAGAKVRWYEIDPNGGSPRIAHSGEAKSASLFAYNGAVSPDRAVDGTAAAFGDAMVLGFNTSSSKNYVAAQMVSRIPPAAQSAFVAVRRSRRKTVAGCWRGVCRWGDYAAATPDPAADTAAAHGVVWLTNAWAGLSGDRRTWNWAAQP
jgi:hypothetical protein